MINGFAGSRVQWAVDKKMFIVHRSIVRDRYNNNTGVWHSMTEEMLAFTRKDDSRGKQTIPRTRRYTPDFAKKYEVNGKPTNIFRDYVAPPLRCRLRDYLGKELRNNAEKSMLLNEYFMDLFTAPGELVVDLCAGTASMGLACVKGDRCYYGSEIEEEVHQAATLRMGRMISLNQQGHLRLWLNQPGLSRSYLEQVWFDF